MDCKLVQTFFLSACLGYFVKCILVEDHPITLAAEVATMEILSKWQTHLEIPLCRSDFGEKHSNMLEQAIAQAPTLSHGYDLQY